VVSVSRLPGASTPDVVGRVADTARDVAATFPAGVRIEPVYDQALLVRRPAATACRSPRRCWPRAPSGCAPS
jgi:Cu/Ag efflux pump CusA